MWLAGDAARSGSLEAQTRPGGLKYQVNRDKGQGNGTQGAQGQSDGAHPVAWTKAAGQLEAGFAAGCNVLLPVAPTSAKGEPTRPRTGSKLEGPARRDGVPARGRGSLSHSTSRRQQR